MNSVGKRVPPSAKPRMCADCKKKRVIKGKSLCATCEFEAERRSTKAQEQSAAK